MADEHGPRRPLPAEESHTRPYWEAARRRQLAIQFCAACDLFIHPPRFCCPRCQVEDPSWRQVSGRGVLYSFSVMHQSGSPGFDNLPFAVAIVELAEQPGLFAVGNVLDCPPQDLQVGMALEVVFETVAEDCVLPQWRRSQL